MPHADAFPCDTLGDAILRARDAVLASGEGHTVVLDGRTFCVMPSARYAALRERGATAMLEPLFSFLPRGGLDVHRASFQPLVAALQDHPNVGV